MKTKATKSTATQSTWARIFGTALIGILMVSAAAFAAVPDAPALVSPADAAQNQQLAPTLTWNASIGATSYQLQVSTINDFSTTVYNDLTLTATSKQIAGLYYETTYYWHVSAKNVDGTSAYSATQSFMTGPSPVNLLTLGRFAVLAYSQVTNVPTSAITGDLGLSPAAGSFYSGFGLLEVTGGMYAVDATGPAPVQMNKALVDQAQLDLGTASVDAAGRTPIPTGTFLNPGSGNLSGLTLPGGLYKFTGTCLISGSVTLTGSVTDVWIFQIAADLSIPNGGIQVILAGDAKASNIFWVTGTAATIGTTDVVKGTIMAHSQVTMATGATLDGRALAATANVTLQSNTITTTAVLPLSLNLGTAASFGVLSGAGVTGTGSITENIGTTTSTIAAPITATGSKYEGTPEVSTAHTDLNTAYLDAAGRNTNVTSLSAGAYELGGGSLAPGVYNIGSDATINGTLTLDGAGIYIFQIGGTLTTAASSHVSLINGAQWHTIYWQVGGTDATLGANSTFNGNLLAKKSIAVGANAAVTGRLLAGADDATGTVSLTNATLLPVEMVSLTATPNHLNAELRWSTATEVNTYGFAVERKTNDTWNNIGFVDGAGTTSAPQNYFFTDYNLSSGTYSYRLKQIDRDGKFEYSQSVEVTIRQEPKEFALMQNYPNPFNPSTTITYQLPANSHVSLKVYDAIGCEVATLVNETKEAGIYSTHFDASKFPSGIYMYRLKAGSFFSTKKLILIK